MNRFRRRAGQDEGYMLLTVLLAMVIMTGLGSVLLLTGIRALPQARHTQDYDAALAAAEAGVDDYVDRLDQNYNYSTTPDSNAAFASYVPISAGSKSSFTYTVDTSSLGVNGAVTLTVKGKVGSVVRTVKVSLRPFGFLDALSMTDYNLVDPALFPVINNSVPQTTARCVFHAYDANATGTGGKGPGSGCGGMYNYWVSGNVLDGPMQSNDEFYLCGTPVFSDEVDSGDPNVGDVPYWKNPSGGSCGADSPTFQGPTGNITGQHFIGLPPSSGALKSQVTPGNPALGCLYTGPTAITLNGNTMSVVSPDTKSTNPGCLGTNVSLPVNGTIYVQDIPGAGDPNFGPCLVTVSWSGDACNQGDVFIKGQLNGALTVAAANNVIVTGDLTYGTGTATVRPVLGLIATNSVEINHPVQTVGCTTAKDGAGYCNTTGTVTFGSGASAVNYSVPVLNPTINAAILSLQHSFAVMNFNEGPANGLGSVNLNGSVSGRFMDIEGVFGAGGALTNGYGVNYHYDARLRNGGLVPPNFLDPQQTFWHRTSFTDCGNGTGGC